MSEHTIALVPEAEESAMESQSQSTPTGYNSYLDSYVRVVHRSVVTDSDGSREVIEYENRGKSSLDKEIEKITKSNNEEAALAISEQREARLTDLPETAGTLTVVRYEATTLDGALGLCGGNSEKALGYFNRGRKIEENTAIRDLVQDTEFEIPEGNYDTLSLLMQVKERKSRVKDPVAHIKKSLLLLGIDLGDFPPEDIKAAFESFKQLRSRQ